MAKRCQLMFRITVGNDFLRASWSPVQAQWETALRHSHRLHPTKMTSLTCHPWTEVDFETKATISSLKNSMDHFQNIRDNESKENIVI